MAKPRKMVSQETDCERIQNRVMVFMVDAPRRPYASFAALVRARLRGDFHDSGPGVCSVEFERRSAIRRAYD